MKLTIEQRKHIEDICERIMKSDFGDEFDFHYFRLCDYIESQYATQRITEVKGLSWIGSAEHKKYFNECYDLIKTEGLIVATNQAIIHCADSKITEANLLDFIQEHWTEKTTAPHTAEVGDEMYPLEFINWVGKFYQHWMDGNWVHRSMSVNNKTKTIPELYGIWLTEQSLPEPPKNSEEKGGQS